MEQRAADKPDDVEHTTVVPMDINDFQLHHTHVYLICQLCAGWIEENAYLACSRDKIVLLGVMTRFGNLNLAWDEDGPLPPLQIVFCGAFR